MMRIRVIAAQVCVGDSGTEEKTQATVVREVLAAKCPRTFARNAAGFPTLALSAGPDDASQPGWLLYERSTGAYTWDIDGNRYIDVHGFGCHILGFNSKLVLDAIRAEIESSGLHQSWMLTRERQEVLATLISEASPAIEKVLFVATGNDAVQMAMRAARAYTGRSCIGLFAGAYHGESDYAIGNSQGVPESVRELVLRLPYNDTAAFEKIREHAGSLAMVLVEALQSSLPLKDHVEWLQELQKVCNDSGVLFGVDETISGFRVAYGGAHMHFHLQPDLLTYGKLIGGGMPIGAVAGRSDILTGFGTSPQAAPRIAGATGSFNGHPLAMAAGKAVITWLKENKNWFYPNMHAALGRLESQMNIFARERGYNCHFISTDGWLDVWFQSESVQRLKDLDFKRMSLCRREFNLQLLSKGVLTAGKFFLNAAMSDADHAYLHEAIQVSLDNLHKDGFV